MLAKGLTPRYSPRGSCRDARLATTATLQTVARGGSLNGVGQPHVLLRGDLTMGAEGVDRQQQKINEFLRLLPLTTEIAGLPHAELGRHFNEGQMEVRANTLRLAYKMARQLLLEIVK